jgi:uncharacterized membrane protein
MEKLKAISILLAALAAALFVLTEQGLLSVQAQKSQTSKITGVVLDANNARIASATIKIENALLNREVQSGEEGNFEFELPAGTYQITVEKDGFRRFVVADFRAKAKRNELIKIHLEVIPPRGTLKVE